METVVVETRIKIRNQDVPAMLTQPLDHSMIRAGIVYVHGSGDGNETDVAVEARRFASMGMAFLTVAKVMDGYTRTRRAYPTLAEDAIEAVEWLRNRPELKWRPIGLLGFSEGGWVSTIAAGSVPNPVDFLVLESPAIVTPGEQIRFHRSAESRSLPFYKRVMARLYTEFAVLICDYSRFDSRPRLQQITIPTYAVWGANDHTIPIERAQALLEQHTNIDVHMEVVPNEPHYLDPEGDWLVDVSNWILAISPGAEPGTTKPGYLE